MVRFLETFYRHRLLVLMPLILALAISTAIALGQPRVYESSARIWFYGQDLAAAIGQPNTTPADQQTAVFRELLNSRAFDVKVGHRGPLAGYLSDPSNVPTDLLSRIRAKLGGSATAPTADQVDQRIWDLLARRVIAGPDGPEVVAISFQASTPAVAQGTVQALVDQFMEETVANRRAQAQAVVTFMEAQLKTQDAAVASATADVTRYVAAHPRAGATDPGLITVQHAADQARARYDELVVELSQARLDLASVDQAGGAGFRVIDPPTLPARPTSLTATLIRTSAAGFGAGLLVALFALFGLTAADTSLRRLDEVRSALGLRPLVAIPEIR